jgi:peptide/nickel transport system ATP-binding protein/oligopeptide transport system ATP-binding protein
VCSPQLLIADEPTTALDVTIQAQILDLMKQLQADLGMSILLITHDLGVVAEAAHHVAVMYSGRIVERTDAPELFANPLHPYTVGLFRSRPSLTKPGDKLAAIPGIVPSPLAIPPGCAFHPRCPLSDGARCTTDRPPLEAKGPRHEAACWYSDRLARMRERGEAIYPT